MATPVRLQQVRAPSAGESLPPRHRLRRSFGLTATFLCGCVLLLALVRNDAALLNIGGFDQLKVYGSLWESGRAASAGLNPYAAYPLTWNYTLHGVDMVDLNLNPPALLPFFAAAAHFDPLQGARVWTFASLGMFCAAAGVLFWHLRDHLQMSQIVWVLCAPALVDSLFLAQIYSLLFVLAAIAWLALKQDRRWVAALALGLLVTMKPNFALWPILLLFRPDTRRSAIVALCVAATLSVIPVLLYGGEVYRFWLEAVRGNPHWSIPTDISVVGYLSRMHAPVAGYLGSALLLALAFRTATRRACDLVALSGLGICASMLCSPLAWFHYSLVLAPVLVECPWRRWANLPPLLLMFPLSLVLASVQGSRVLLALGGTPYFLAVVLLFVSFAGFRATRSLAPRCA
jgi:glycerol uptake facilitator-like aquaporin